MFFFCTLASGTFFTDLSPVRQQITHAKPVCKTGHHGLPLLLLLPVRGDALMARIPHSVILSGKTWAISLDTNLLVRLISELCNSKKVKNPEKCQVPGCQIGPSWWTIQQPIKSKYISY